MIRLICALFFYAGSLATSYAQDFSNAKKDWYGHLELGGNGGYYSLSAELISYKRKISNGNRFGLTFLPSGTFGTGALGGFYERNYILSNKKSGLKLGLVSH